MAGRPLLLLHAGGMDPRMWEPLRDELGDGYDVVAPVLGSSPAADALAALSAPSTLVVGASFGGNVALQVATAAPERVDGLVLFAATLFDGEPSPELDAYWTEEERLVDGGDVEGAVALSVRTWVREPAVAALVADMARAGYAREAEEEGERVELPIDLAGIRAPTLAVSGGLDFPDFAEMADRIAATVPGARRAEVPDAGHLIALERPRAAAALLRDLAGA
ncbi:MAG: alpha/beta fold hydrolase [Solirubrobacteraceae bacterium]